jgi:hypothetical protein
VSAHVHEDLGPYVLDALSEPDRDAVRAHLERCPECRARHAEIANLPGLLDLAAVSGKHDAVPLAPALEERVLDRFAREVGDARPRRTHRLRRLPRRWLFLGGGALAGAAVVALLLVVLVLGQGGERSEGYQLTLRGTGAAPKAWAHAGLEPIAGGTRMYLRVWNLPGDMAAVYEVRCEAPGWSASAGTFHVDRQGHAYVVMTAAARQGEYDIVRVVRRERDGAGRVRVANVLSGRIS